MRQEFKVVKCGHKGCDRTNEHGTAIYTVGKVSRCTEHFADVATEAKKGKKNARK